MMRSKVRLGNNDLTVSDLKVHKVNDCVPVMLGVGLKRRLEIGGKRTSRRSEITPISKSKGAFDVQELFHLSGVRKRIAKYRQAQKVYSQGNIADAVFFIQEGGIKMSAVNHRGKEAIVGLMGIGDFFGEGCLAGQHLRNATAVAITSSTLIVIEKQEMVHALRCKPELSECFLYHMLTRNVRTEEDLINRFFNSSEERLARVLLKLAQNGEKSLQDNVIYSISQEMLANMVGTTRSRISEFMNRFRKMGFVKYDRHGIQIYVSRLGAFLRE
jgi:CRP/FNR family transcriptional regulator, cyclic AMP receptor protein